MCLQCSQIQILQPPKPQQPAIPALGVVDFFCGCGGTSAGMEAAGARIILGIDNDPDAADTFEANFPAAAFLRKNIATLPAAALAPHIRTRKNIPILFSACAPCQPFSKQVRQRAADDKRISLLLEFVRFVEGYLPELIFLENVPGLQSLHAEQGPFELSLARLKKLGYHATWNIVDSRDYGVPQRRRRLILLASRLAPIDFPPPTHGPGTAHPGYATVWEAIGHLPPISAGERHPEIPYHQAANLSPTNLQRIRTTPPGGGRESWPEHLRLDCHKDGYSGHIDVYGRMRKDSPATGLTTRCISLSNGRFGHPEQNRAISLLEASLLQTFPPGFVFKGTLSSIARQIGNAVPVLMAQKFGEHLLSHLGSVGGSKMSTGDGSSGVRSLTRI